MRLRIGTGDSYINVSMVTEMKPAGARQLAPLRRGFSILRILAGQEGWCTFSRLQELSGSIAAPTLSRLLGVLIDERLVEKHAGHGRYRKGPALVDLAHTVLGSMPKARILQPIIDNLADRTGQSAALFELDDKAIVMVAKAERPNSCHYIDIGARNTDIVRHGFARAILAFLDESQARELLQPRRHSSPAGVAEFRAIRERSVCIERSESKPDWMRVAAPVFGGRADGVPDALGITTVDLSDDAAREEALCAAVVAAARRASETLQQYYAAQIPESLQRKGADG